MAYGDLLKSQVKILKEYLKKNPNVFNIKGMDYDTFKQIEDKKDSEFLYNAIENYIDDFRNDEAHDRKGGSSWEEEH